MIGTDGEIVGATVYIIGDLAQCRDKEELHTPDCLSASPTMSRKTDGTMKIAAGSPTA